MNIPKKFLMIMSTAFLAMNAPIALSASDSAEREADRLEDRADQVRKVDEKSRESLEKRGEAAADRKEEDAKQLRKAAEDKADRMEDDADRVRKATEK